MEDSDKEIKQRELEQTQELLVGLTQELFNKTEELESKKKTENAGESKEEFGEKEVEPQGQTKIEFTDLSWYQEKLDKNKKIK